MNRITKAGLIFCILLFMISSISYAQSNFYGELRGMVYDSVRKEPLPFANVILYQNKIIMAGVSTDLDGKYVIKPVKQGIYNLEASFVGYKIKIFKDIKIDSSGITVLNVLLFQPDVQIKEVDIESSSKPVIDRDEGSSMRTTSLVGITAGMVTRSPGDIPSPGLITFARKDIPSKEGENLSGILTAGELNDYSKWELWKDVNQGDLKSMQDYWKFKPFERYTVQLISSNGRPLADCEVSLLNKDKKPEWTSRTDNTGKAELWVNIFADNTNKKGYSINVNYKGQNYKINKIFKFSDGINIITLPADCGVLKKADVMFVVDATGSMGDEIEYLKSELNNIILKVKEQNSNLELNLGAVFYRDKGDVYLTDKSDFSPDLNKTIDFVKHHSAGGGGDEPEAVHTALNVAINDMKWSDSAMARLMFLVLDAPPHYTPEIIDSLQMLIKEASEKGIRIIPITGSGINKSAEYLMRAFALATNGTYVFLTDHSHVGNSHIKPTTDEYDVQLLKDVLLRIIHQYLFIPSCDNNLELTDKQLKDTMYVVNPKIIAHEIADSLLVGKYKDHIVPVDSNRISFVDTTKARLKTDSISVIADKGIPNFTNFRYFPNPTTGKLNIEIKGKIDELYLADISGKLLERYLVKGNEKLEINISRYPVGVYFLQYLYSNKWLTGKVVLTR